jgi:biopolymer transport protein ExbD
VISIFIKLFNEGGWVLYPIFAVSVTVWYMGIGRAVKMRRLNAARMKLLAAMSGNQSVDVSNLEKPFDFLLTRLQKSITTTSHRRACAQFMGKLTPLVETGVSTIAACVVISPLLGLLGTITGMNELFAVIGKYGFGNPTIMANGIGIALQATLTGLGVAVAALFVYDYIKRKKQNLLDTLHGDLEHLALGKDDEAHTDEGVDMYAQYRLVSDENEKPDINLAPFVDTIMILLIFFVVTANLYVETGVDVSKPKAQSAKSVGQKAILIGITREGTVHMYGRQVSLDRLKLLVEQEVTKNAELSIVIIADRASDVGRAVEVMDQCSMAGAQKISLAAGKEGQQ